MTPSSVIKERTIIFLTEIILPHNHAVFWPEQIDYMGIFAA